MKAFSNHCTRRQFGGATATLVAAAALPELSAAPQNDFAVPFAAAFPKFRIWDVHCHLGRPNITPAEHMTQLLGYADRVGIEKVVIAMGLTPHLANPKPEELRQRNEDMLAAVKAKPERALGLVFVSPLHVKESLAEMDRLLPYPNVVGLKLWIACRCNDPRIDPIVKKAAEYRATIHQHVWDNAVGNKPGESSPEDLVELARRHPSVHFVAMHSGGDWERGLRTLRKVRNITAEIAGCEPTSGYVEMAVRELGPDRVIYASDASGRSFASQLAKVHEARVSNQVKQKIFAGNFRRLAGM